ncbi:hypothetical protein LWI28_002069 [Acer negundo]|uniref:Seed maturation protein n=1 Tax=Acer negundo TaxID=4023 RepID=A0AAD5ISA3_ACENE|nr:hypothetical protein LWI28_002069 [Acer negundo]KAK4845392.1 hypothetical protein QYF36_004443 [Acer negundo]
MQPIKEKVSNTASSGKAHVDIYKAKAEEKVEKAAARTEEEKEIAHHLRKAKEAQAKMELHNSKAQHAADKLRAKQSQPHHTMLGTVPPQTGTAVPSYPLGGNPTPAHKKHTYM